MQFKRLSDVNELACVTDVVPTAGEFDLSAARVELRRLRAVVPAHGCDNVRKGAPGENPMFDSVGKYVPRDDGEPRPWPSGLVAILAIRHIDLGKQPLD